MRRVSSETAASLGLWLDGLGSRGIVWSARLVAEVPLVGIRMTNCPQNVVYSATHIICHWSGACVRHATHSGGTVKATLGSNSVRYARETCGIIESGVLVGNRNTYHLVHPEVRVITIGTSYGTGARPCEICTTYLWPNVNFLVLKLP